MDRTVTPCSFSHAGRRGPLLTREALAATRVAPAWNASQISSTEASKAMENPWKTRSGAATPKSLPSARTRLQTERWATATPLGRPVDPLVKMA